MEIHFQAIHNLSTRHQTFSHSVGTRWRPVSKASASLICKSHVTILFMAPRCHGKSGPFNISTKNIYWKSIYSGPIYGCVPVRGSSRNPFSLLTQWVAAEEGSAEQSQQCKSINCLGIGEFLYLI